jgi:putative toxin-antitoxin system antitoxin component (TIGR02293 family)
MVGSIRLPAIGCSASRALPRWETAEVALHWLRRPQVGLGGRTPLAMLTTDLGRDQVEKLLLHIEHGVYS